MTRRTFSGLLGGAAAFMPRDLDAQAAVPPHIHDLYERSIAIDCLASPQSFNIPWPPQDQGLLDDQRANIRNSGITAINLTINGATFEETISHIAFWMGEVERDSSLMTIVRNTADIQAAKQLKRLGLMFGFQGTDVLGTDLTRLVQFRRLGVRIMQLTYNTRSLAGDGCLEPGNAGLSSFGRQMVARMNELGIAVDLGHCGMQTCSDAIALSRKPVLITHSGCRAVYDHPRNKTDVVLKSCADRGGVVGIYLMPFVGGKGAPTAEIVMQHIEHAVKVCGIDHVGIGSDQSITPIRETLEYLKEWERFSRVRQASGSAAPDEDRPLYTPEFNSPRRLELIAAELAKRGYDDSGIQKIIGGNFQRVLGEIWAG